MKKVKRANASAAARMASRRSKLRRAEKVRKKLRRAGSVLRGATNSSMSPLGLQANSPWEDYECPEVLDFFANMAETFEFFRGLNESISEKGRKIRISFERTRNISSEALIYLLGQIHKLQSLHGKNVLTGYYPKNRKIEHLLNESGFLNLLGVRTRAVAGRKTGGTRFLTYKTGNKLLCEAIPKIRYELFGRDFDMLGVVKAEVFRVLSEAMNNVREHAYINKFHRRSGMKGRWWMGANMSMRNNTFSLTFYDAGAGIPRTIPRKYDMGMIRGALSILPEFDLDDGSLIKAAVQIGRTRTRKDNRGKGLMDLHKLIDRVGAGKLSIISCQGWYKYGASSSDSYGSSESSIEGTLISWELPLNAAAVRAEGFSIQDQEFDDEKNIYCA